MTQNRIISSLRPVLFALFVAGGAMGSACGDDGHTDTEDGHTDSEDSHMDTEEDGHGH